MYCDVGSQNCGLLSNAPPSAYVAVSTCSLVIPLQSRMSRNRSVGCQEEATHGAEQIHFVVHLVHSFYFLICLPFDYNAYRQSDTFFLAVHLICFHKSVDIRLGRSLSGRENIFIVVSVFQRSQSGDSEPVFGI